MSFYTIKKIKIEIKIKKNLDIKNNQNQIIKILERKGKLKSENQNIKK